MFLIEWFDIAWFWLGRVTGGLFLLALVIGLVLTILEHLWCVVEQAGKVIKETKLFLEFLKWRKDQGAR